MRTCIVGCILAALPFAGAVALNPIVPPGLYIADPSAHVWKDGKVYVYGSKDESVNYYCSWEYHALWSSDMINWRVDRHIFSSRDVGFNDNLLYAPDCQYRAGKYYLYFCNDNGEEGVATSPSPSGPFGDSRRIELPRKGIDPCVFIDDDGQGYYIWGQFSAKVARLKPSMTEIDPATVHDGVVTEKEHFFHEGAYMIRRNGIYYLIYADISRANRPSCLGYSTAASPFGPFTYRGVIIDDDHCDPLNWTNHGSLVEFNGQWYVFYHRSTHNSVMMRKPCVEPVRFSADGAIREVEMTTQGAEGPLDARRKMDAERACLLSGSVYVEACTPDNEMLTSIRNDDRAAYKYLDFGTGMDSVIVRVVPGRNGGRIRLVADQFWHGEMCVVNIPPRKEAGGAITLRRKLDRPVNGVHALWLHFLGQGSDLFDVDWFEFK
ncbi:MAG: family 43 glycosylhydrolase [Rikenellaceae bacterium]|nr:family 43 glycosylhydrolase [Rikenellaceae bacterium]